MLISEGYRQQNAELHVNDPSWGHCADWFLSAVQHHAWRVQAKTILDYGAGKQKVKYALPSLCVISYDPAIPEIAKNNVAADLVISNAVLEHIEPECLDAVLDDIRRCAKIAVLLTVSTIPSSKTLPDGRDPHLLLYPLEWWLPKLMDRWMLKSVARTKQAFMFFGMAL